MTTNEQDLAYVEMLAKYERARDANLIVCNENRRLRSQLKGLSEAAERVWQEAEKYDESDCPEMEALRAALDAPVPSAGPTLKERLQANTEALIATPDWVRKSVSVGRIFDIAQVTNTEPCAPVYAELEHIRKLQAERDEARALLATLREAAEGVMPHWEPGTSLMARSSDARDLRAALDSQVPSAGPSAAYTELEQYFLEAQDECVKLKAELETSRESARKWKNELESVRRERDEARTNNVKHIERGKWLTAEMYKWQDSCHKAQRERDAALRLLAEERPAPRAQVFDPALVRELLELCDQERACCTAEFLGKPTPWHGWPDLLTCCTALRDSENRVAEPYGIAETDRLLAVISARFGVGDQVRDLAEAVRNSRSAK